MNYHVHITKRAEMDLNRALDYIEFSLKNPQAADSLLDEAETALASLDQMPERYALADDKLLAAWGIRFVQVKKYLAFYVIAKECVCQRKSRAKGLEKVKHHQHKGI